MQGVFASVYLKCSNANAHTSKDTYKYSRSALSDGKGAEASVRFA